MPDTTIAETVAAGSGSGIVGVSNDDVGDAQGGLGAVQTSGVEWHALSPDPKNDQGGQDTCTETTEPPLIPKVFPVYPFI